MLKRFLFSIFVLTVFISCRAAEETVVNGQTRVETNIKTQQIDDKNSKSEAKSKTFAKAFIINKILSDNARDFVYTEHLVEFKDDDAQGISVFVDTKKKTSLKIETNNPQIRADFLESNGERYFVMAVASAGSGSCGDAIFAVVKISEKLDANMSKTNEPVCQGEYYDVKIESNDSEKDFYRRISIGSLKFNLNSFDWNKESKK